MFFMVLGRKVSNDIIFGPRKKKYRYCKVHLFILTIAKMSVLI